MLTIITSSRVPIPLLLVVALVLLFSTALGDDWPSFRHDIENTGSSDDTGPGTSNVLWSYDCSPGSGDFLMRGSPAVVNGSLYIVGNDSLYCFDADSGGTGPKWVSSLGDNSTSSPAVSSSKVYVLSGEDDRRLYCFSAATGNRIWRTSALGDWWRYCDGDGGWPEGSPKVVGDSCVYVGARDGKLYSIHTSAGGPGLLDGQVKWSTQIALADTFYCGFVASTPAVKNNRVVVGSGISGSSDMGGVFCLHATTGDTLWWYEYDDGWRWGVKSSPAIYGDSVYIGTDEYPIKDNCGAVHKFLLTEYDPDDPIDPLESEWFGCAVLGSPAVYSGKVFTGTGVGFHCLDAGTLEREWSKSDGEIFSSPAIAKVSSASTKRYVYYAGSNTLKCRDADDGDLIWSASIGVSKYTSPVLADGNLYVAADSGIVYCYGASRRGANGNTPTLMYEKVESATLSGIGVLRVAPNPFAGDVRIHFDSPFASADKQHQLRVLDVTGRVVRTLEASTLQKGGGVVLWRGESDNGHKAAAGLYYVQLRTPRGTLTERVMLLR